MKLEKCISYLLLLVLCLSVPISTAHAISAKTQGKLALVAILSGIAVLTKHIMSRDRRTVEEIHARLGKPDRVIEYERGFDRWRIEWYGSRRYRFRNGVLQQLDLFTAMPSEAAAGQECKPNSTQ